LDVERGNIPDWVSSSKPTSADTGSEPEWLTAPPAAGSLSDSIPEWMKIISPADAPAAAQPLMEKVPDWLQENPAPQSKPVEIIPEWMRDESAPPPDTRKENPTNPFGPESDIPEWMKSDTAETSATSNPPPIPEPESGSIAPMVAPELATLAAAQEDTPEIGFPDWMTSPAPSAPVAPPPAPLPTPVQPEANVPDILPEVPLPDWLASVAPSVSTIPAAVQPIPSPTPPAPVQPLQITPETVSEVSMPDWLKNAPPPPPAAPATPSAAAMPAPAAIRQPEAPSEVFPDVALPDWLTSATPPAPAAPAPAPAIATPPPAEVQREASAEAFPEVALPDWLTSTVPPAPAAPAPAPAISTPPPAEVQREASAVAFPEVALPDWLKDAVPPSFVGSIPTLTPPAPISTPAPTPAAVQPVGAIPEAIPEVNVSDWIKASSPPSPPALVPSMPVASGSVSELKTRSVASQAAPVIPAPEAVQKSEEPAPPELNLMSAAPISEGIELPDWLVAQLKGKPAEPAPNPAAAKPAIPMPDWLKPSTQNLATSPVVNWEEAADQPLPSIPADATRPAMGATPRTDRLAPGGAEIPAWLDKSKPSGNETVARWLDRRLKTSTLSSLEDASTRSGQKPLSPSPTPSARPAQSSTQLPTWLDSQKPGGSDTVVRWMDKRDTGSLRRAPQSAFSDAGKTPFPAPGESAPAQPEIPQAAPFAKPPVYDPGMEETVASRKPAAQNAASVPRSGNESARPMMQGAGSIPSPEPPEPIVRTSPPVPPPPPAAVAPEEEEEDGAFVPPPEWLQKALGSAVEDVPPIPKQQAPVLEAAKPPPPTRTPVDDKPVNIRWQPPSVEEPAPVTTAKPTPWVPIAPPQAAPETGAKPVKKAVKKKTRKLSDIESEVLIREARVYLDSDLQKASDVYQKVIENPASAEVVANDLTSYLEQDPASPQLWNLLGDACNRAGRFQDAYRAYAEALRRM
jgi:hypothetical protein